MGADGASTPTPVQKRDAKAVLAARGRAGTGSVGGYSKTEDCAALTLVAMLVLSGAGAGGVLIAVAATAIKRASSSIVCVRSFVGAGSKVRSSGSTPTSSRRAPGSVGGALVRCGQRVGVVTRVGVIIDELCQHPETQAVASPVRHDHDVVAEGCGESVDDHHDVGIAGPLGTSGVREG